MKKDFNRFLIRDGVVAGYGVFSAGRRRAEAFASSERRTDGPVLLPDPHDAGDHRRALHAGPGASPSRRHPRSISCFPTARASWTGRSPIMAGPETIFRRANRPPSSAAKSGSCMSIRICATREAMSDLGEREALWDALLVANPIAVTDGCPTPSLRQRNAYFSSSDAAFRDRYQASADWERVKTGRVAVGRRVAHLFQRTWPLRLSPRSSTPSGFGGASASGSSNPACRRRRKASSCRACRPAEAAARRMGEGTPQARPASESKVGFLLSNLPNQCYAADSQNQRFRRSARLAARHELFRTPLP